MLGRYEAIKADSHGLDDMDYARMLGEVDDAAWTPEHLTRAAELALGGGELTARALQQRVAANNPAAHTQLLAEIEAGSTRALEGVGDLRLLPPAAVTAAIDQFSQRVSAQRAEAQKGSYPVYRIDPLSTLAMLNRWHPSLANWDEVHQALTEPRLMSDQMVGVLRALAAKYNGYLEESDRERLIEAIRPLAAREPRHPLFDGEDIRGAAMQALASLGDDVDLAGALAGGPALRRAAAAIIGYRNRPSDVELIIALAHDPDGQVNAAAAAGLGRYATATPPQPAAVNAAIALIQRSGTTIAKNIAHAVDPQSLGPETTPLLDLLLNHESATVRALLRPETPPSG